MQLVMFDDGAGPRLGVLRGAAIQAPAHTQGLPATIQALCEGGPALLARLRDAVPDAPRHRVADVRLLAPFPRPARNVFCVGKNYLDHAHEFNDSGFDASAGGQAVPDRPVVFTKAPSAVIGPGETIPAHLDPTGSTDYEGELTVVIGQGGRGIAAARAFRHVFGYTIINDVTARTLQHAHKQWFLGKSIDGYCPMGPCVLTADAVPDVRHLRLQTRVNDELRQDAPLSDLIFDIPTLIEAISARITLEPGDLIATGTPAGVGIGFKPPRYLKAGDVVAITVDGIGTLSNPVG